MDKQATVGFILIGIVLVAWMWLQTPRIPPATAPHSDSLHAVMQDTAVHPAAPAPAPQDTATQEEAPSRFFASRVQGRERVVTIKTDLYTAQLTTRGGLLHTWELRKFLSWDKLPVQLVDYKSGGDFSVLFTSSDGKLVNTRSLMFDASGSVGETVDLTGGGTISIDMVLPMENGGRIVKRFTFTNGTYEFDVELVFEGAANVISNFEYQVVWEHGLRYAEQNSVDESGFASASALTGGEMVQIDATRPNEPQKLDVNGATSWVATHTKYFVLAILAEEGKTQGAYLEGHATPAPNNGMVETYAVALKMPYRGGAVESAKFQVYLGPMEYHALRAYGRGLEKTISLGATWIIRPIAEYFMVPLFEFLHSFIANYGLVILVFSIIIKVLLHPLTRTSMRSMRKLQALQPMMNEIREKYKGDAEKMGQAQMNLSKEYGINPASGCLPLLLQMPILFALYQVFRSTIGLRQAGFIWWIKDLSIPDTIVHLPFTVPFFGINQISGITLAMGITMFVQQKMTPADPRNKAMVWLMPLMFTLMFNNLPSGLNLYYFIFNLLSIGQQYLFNRQHKNEPLRKVEAKKKSGGILGKISKDLPKVRR
jgi:YidC/Oxa1 family membrane protein insertase